MNVPAQGSGLVPRRSPARTTVVAAVAAVAILVLAAAWPVGGRGPAVLSSAVADAPPAQASPAAATGAARDSSVPDAATVLADQPIYAETLPPQTF